MADEEKRGRRGGRRGLPRLARGREGVKTAQGGGAAADQSEYELMVQPTFPTVSSFHAASNIGTRNSNFLAGFSVTVLALLLSFSDIQAFALLLTVLFLILAIAYLLFATESFFRLAQARSGEEVTFWATWGSGLYGLGTSGLIGAVALMLHALSQSFSPLFQVLPYLIVAVFSVGWAFYAGARARWQQSGRTPRGGWAVLMEAWSVLMFLHLGSALALVVLLQAGVL